VSRSAGIVDDAPPVSERAFPAGQASVRRVHMRDRVTIGQWWKTKRRRGGRTVRIRQVHRAERRVDVVDGDDQRFQLTFSELRRFYRQVEDGTA
jgi:hypothetical protein